MYGHLLAIIGLALACAGWGALQLWSSGRRQNDSPCDPSCQGGCRRGASTGAAGAVERLGAADSEPPAQRTR